jgi:hypothetical protein
MGTEVQVANLETRAQNVQLRVGIVMVTAALVVGMVMDRLGAGRLSHLALVPMFFVGVYGLGAAILKTCGVTAFMGKRRTETGVEPVADRQELAALRRRGAALIGGSAVVAVAAAALFALR